LQFGAAFDIVFVDGRVKQAIVANEDIMREIIPVKAMESLREKGLKIVGALINGYHIRVIPIIKRHQEPYMLKAGPVNFFEQGNIAVVAMIEYNYQAGF
jgi:hypothetical protein